MKSTIIALALCSALLSCKGISEEKTGLKNQPFIEGTWQLITGVLIEKNDTTITDYTKNISFIKIINGTHFSFLEHDVNKGKNSDSLFVAGGGTYTLRDSTYTEHLAYCSDRQWEGNSFTFTVNIKGDTLTQRGMENVLGTPTSRLNTETYVRIK